MVKGGVLIGVAMFLLGEGGEFAASAYYESVPGWEHTLFLTLAVVGILVALFSPFVFGVALPLTE